MVTGYSLHIVHNVCSDGVTRGALIRAITTTYVTPFLSLTGATLVRCTAPATGPDVTYVDRVLSVIVISIHFVTASLLYRTNCYILLGSVNTKHICYD